MRDDGIRKADEQTKDEADKPAWPTGQLNATNDESNDEATGEGTEQRCGFVRKRHRQHEADIQRSKYYSSDQTENDFRHLDSFSKKAARIKNLRS
jgi:hypothetical protein